MNIKAILWIESAAFFLIANWFYVRWLLTNDVNRRTLFITLVVFALLGIVIPVFFVELRGDFQTGTGIGIFFTMIVFIGYGFTLWTINRFLKNIWAESVEKDNP